MFASLGLHQFVDLASLSHHHVLFLVAHNALLLLLLDFLA